MWSTDIVFKVKNDVVLFMVCIVIKAVTTPVQVLLSLSRSFGTCVPEMFIFLSTNDKAAKLLKYSWSETEEQIQCILTVLNMR